MSDRNDVGGSESKDSGGFWDTIKTVFYAVIIALVVRTVAYEPFNIPSSSMVPTLLVGDYLFVAKYPYGYSRFSFDYFSELIGLSRIPGAVGGDDGRILFDAPERGDVAVFKLPRDNATDYIKRIVGLPGDRIQVIGGVLHINGEAVPRERIDDFVETDRYGRTRRTAQYTETLPNGARYNVLDKEPAGWLDNTEVYVVPAGHYFAMGDNRDNSQDSRVSTAVGFIPAENLVGRAELIFYSTDGGAELWEVWNWPAATRFARLFQVVD